VSVSAERSILGSILLDPKAYDEATGIGLEDGDFSLDSHRRIFRAIGCLAENSMATDTVTLVNFLQDHSELKAVGDVGYISALLDGIPIRPSVKSYVRIVKEASSQRKLLAASTHISEKIQDRTMDSGEAMDWLSDRILEVRIGSDEYPAQRVTEFSNDTYTQWLALCRREDDLVGLSTGIGSLDMATTGIREAERWVYAGRTGDGKTNLALQTIASSCRNDISVGFFSIEMTKESLLHRLWAGESGVDFNHIRFPRRLQAATTKKIEEAMIDVAKWPLHIVEESSIGLSKLIAKAKLLIRREKIKLLVVDYVQLVSTSGKDEKERITKVSHSLMALAKDSGVPVIEISQLARPRDGNENHRPTIYNLKESGTIENDADVVILIYRPVDDRKQKTGEDELIVGKQRNGSMGIEKVCFMPWLRFHERTTL
jgi:replicative DNA helicase